MADHDLIELVKQMDRCWIERRFDDLPNYLAPEITVFTPYNRRFQGLPVILQNYRDFMDRNEVRSFEPSDFHVTEAGDAAIVEYVWAMDWAGGAQIHSAKGREVLALSRRDGAWRIFWRAQIPIASTTDQLS
jgi:ketosteroid isomerase-like protein